MTEIIIVAFVILAVRSLYKTFLQPGWHKSKTYRDWSKRHVR
jgi:hypothetical protein